MEVRLIIKHGKSAGQKIVVSGPKFFIGRSEECQLRPNSELISRHHCVIVTEEGYVGVRDFGSRNGTQVNGQPVHGEQELKNGDRLHIGPLELEVELVVPVGGKKKPKVRSISEAAARTAQKAATGGDDMDMDWLMEDDDQPAARPAARPAAKADAPTVALKPPTPPDEKEPPAPPPEKEKKPDKAIQAWRGVEAKPAVGNSRDAAADMLKNFRKRY